VVSRFRDLHKSSSYASGPKVRGFPCGKKVRRSSSGETPNELGAPTISVPPQALVKLQLSRELVITSEALATSSPSKLWPEYSCLTNAFCNTEIPRCLRGPAKNLNLTADLRPLKKGASRNTAIGSVRDDSGEIYTVRYEAVNAMLLNEFLKEHRKVEKQGATIEQQQKEIAALAAQLKEQSALIQKVSDQLEASKPAPHLIANN